MKCLVLLFIFIFSPVAIVVGHIGKTEIDKTRELLRNEAISKTVKNESIELFSDWKIAEASYYDPNDSTQTKENPDGIGNFERAVGSGSVALGSYLTELIRKDGVKVFIQVKDFNVMTPYGKGIFRVDDTMAERYNKEGMFYVDFFHKDLSFKHLRQGRFKIMFKIIKIETSDIGQAFFY